MMPHCPLLPEEPPLVPLLPLLPDAPLLPDEELVDPPPPLDDELVESVPLVWQPTSKTATADAAATLEIVIRIASSLCREATLGGPLI